MILCNSAKMCLQNNFFGILEQSGLGKVWIHKDGNCSVMSLQKATPSLHFNFWLPSESPEYSCFCAGSSGGQACPNWTLQNGEDWSVVQNYSKRSKDEVCFSFITLSREVTANETSRDVALQCAAVDRTQFQLIRVSKVGNTERCNQDDDCLVPGQVCSNCFGFCLPTCTCPTENPVYVPGSPEHCYPAVYPGRLCYYDQQCWATVSRSACLGNVNASMCVVLPNPPPIIPVIPSFIPVIDVNVHPNYRYSVAGGCCAGGAALAGAMAIMIRRRTRGSSRRGSLRPLVVAVPGSSTAGHGPQRSLPPNKGTTEANSKTQQVNNADLPPSYQEVASPQSGLSIQQP